MAGYIDKITGIFKREQVSINDSVKEAVTAYLNNNGWVSVYNGEKNIGELGRPQNLMLDYQSLRTRSWEAFMNSEVARTIILKYALWIIGDGLKLKASPNKVVLKSEGITLENSEAFNEVIEARFETWAKSKKSSYSGMSSLNEIAYEAHKNALIGGDVLVILRYIKKNLTVQIIDGAHVKSPNYGTELVPQKLANGNTIVEGVELDSTGNHIAYWIQKSDLTYERIEATNRRVGFSQAFLVYGKKYRIDNIRGLPTLSSVLETLSKLERYKEAMVGSAEERAKIVYQVVHSVNGTGETPLSGALAKAFDASGTTEPSDISGKALANNIAVTTNKQTFNMPIGAELRSLASGAELQFKEFYSTNSDITCACVGIPPNVAFSLYNDSFSASRAATKDWEHTIKVDRNYFSEQFYARIYSFFLYIQVMEGKVVAKGYEEAVMNDNLFVRSAYENARWTGDMFPHIDPLKEVNAERLKLGETAKNIPLTTIENSIETLGGGDSDSIMEQYSEELKMNTKLQGIQEK